MFSLKPIEDASDTIPETSANDNERDLCIAYRVPVPSKVTLSIHDGRENEELQKAVIGDRYELASDAILTEALTMVPQFGRTAYLTLNNQMFDDNNINVTFSAATGAPLKLVYESSSKGEAASAAESDAAN